MRRERTGRLAETESAGVSVREQSPWRSEVPFRRYERPSFSAAPCKALRCARRPPPPLPHGAHGRGRDGRHL